MNCVLGDLDLDFQGQTYETLTGLADLNHGDLNHDLNQLILCLTKSIRKDWFQHFTLQQTTSSQTLQTLIFDILSSDIFNSYNRLHKTKSRK